MAYSIYFNLKPEALNEVKHGDLIVYYFQEEYTRSRNKLGNLFGWVKPRNRQGVEHKLFTELSALQAKGLVTRITADEWNTEPSLEEKLERLGFPELIPLVRPDCE